MDIGRIIYYHRKDQGKTQEEVCKGICSITHLSKIENNSKEANLDTLNLLCEQLGISIEIEEKKLQDLKKEINLFYDSIERLHSTKAESIYKSLKDYRSYINCTNLVYLYELYEIRYYLFLNKLDNVEEMLTKISKHRRKFSQYESYLLEFLHAIYYFKRKEFISSLEILNNISELVEQFNNQVREYYYFKALVHSKLNHSTLAIHFGHKALTIFQETSNIYRILHVKTIMAIHLIHTCEYKKAEILLLELLDDADLMQNVVDTARVLHNLGFLYESDNKLVKALDYYSKSLQLKQKHTPAYYLTIANIAQVYVNMQEFQKAEELLKEELVLLKEQEDPTYVNLNVLYLKTLKDEKELIDYLINHGLPIMQKHDQLTKAVEYAEKIASYYLQSDCLLANHYLCISNNILKNLLNNKGGNRYEKVH
jgi:HTH-type transcriptional regulator, quorum sensing regulator NprR